MGLLVIIAFVAILRPPKVHLLIMVLDELGDFGYLSIVQNSTLLEQGIAIVFHKELGRTSLGEFTVAGMYVHALHHTERREIEIVTCTLK